MERSEDLLLVPEAPLALWPPRLEATGGQVVPGRALTGGAGRLGGLPLLGGVGG